MGDSRTDILLDSVLGAIGNTPLVELSRLTRGLEGRILAKLEYLNPGFSKKDRIARSSPASTRRARCRSDGCSTMIPGCPRCPSVRQPRQDESVATDGLPRVLTTKVY